MKEEREVGLVFLRLLKMPVVHWVLDLMFVVMSLIIIGKECYFSGTLIED